MNHKIFIILTYLLFNISIFPKSPFSKKKIRELVEFTRELAKKEIKLGEKYSPFPGEEDVHWDSSGTAQYFYKKFFNIYIPRISYSQYKLLKNSSLLKIPELEEDDFIDPIKLKSRLKRGDLLFWTNTHDEIPEYRDPPISHVMIFVGVSKAGNFLMVGAGTKGVGETTTGGGVDLYIFEPNQVMGCVKNETGECKINSKFVGFGRFYLKKNKSAIKYLLNLKE